MDHTAITMIGPREWEGSIGKETSNTSFSVRALKKDDRIVTVLSPSKYPEKVWSLLFTLALTDRILLNVEKIDRDLGEIIIAIDLLGKKKGMLHVSEMVDRTLFSDLTKGTVIEGWEEMDPDPNILRESMFDMHNDWKQEPNVVVIDQAFPVKGVGTVALGFVTSGSIKKHHQMITYPGGKRTQVRSIQIHDRDHDEARAGARVGLALKNIEVEDLPRGCALSDEDSPLEEVTGIDLRLRISPFWKEPIEKGMHLHLWSSLQFTPCTIEEVSTSGDGTTVRIEPESPIWKSPDSTFALVHLDSKTFRVFAAGESI